jgi:GT2 family glycosyltransferase
MTCEISVVIACHNEVDNLKWTVDSFLETRSEKTEVIVVDDHSTDGGTSFLESDRDSRRMVRLLRPPTRVGAAGARSFGADNSRGRFVVFSDAHVKVSPGWDKAIGDALSNPAVGAVSPVISDLSKPERRGFGRTWQGEALDWKWLSKKSGNAYPVPLLPGCFLAMRRDVINCVGGFDSGFHLWGSEGAELSLRLWLMGYECHVLPCVDAAHLFRPTRPYSVGWESVLHNTMRMAVLHFSAARVARLVSSLTQRSGFVEAFTQLMSSDAWEKREHFKMVRVHDDDWFFDHFQIDCLSQP